MLKQKQAQFSNEQYKIIGIEYYVSDTKKPADAMFRKFRKETKYFP